MPLRTLRGICICGPSIAGLAISPKCGCCESKCVGLIQGHCFFHPRLELLDVHVLDGPYLDMTHLLSCAFDSVLGIGQDGPVEEAQ